MGEGDGEAVGTCETVGATDGGDDDQGVIDTGSEVAMAPVARSAMDK